MIRLLGNMDASEGEAAESLQSIILETWPWIEKDVDSSVYIVAGVKCHSQAVRDLDIVVLAQFSELARYSPFLSFFDSWDNTLKKPNTIAVRSLCLIIEVKDSGPENARFAGTHLEIRYGNEWKSATEQSHKQVFALRNYLQHSRIAAPHITNLIWLRNIANVDLPKRPHNILGGNATWDLFLNVIGQQSPPRHSEGSWFIDAAHSYGFESFKSCCDLLTKTIQPTHLDRVRMDRICRSAVNKEWFDALGVRQLIFHGRGGTGKTVILLRLAWKAYEERQSRILILTYNKALVADLRRLFTLMNVPDSLSANTIQIQTIHSVLHSVFRGFGLESDEDSFLKSYEESKERALTYIKEGAVTSSDIASLVKSDEFSWDYVLVDEGQDWPENERDILRTLYSHRQFAIAEGIDQLVRSEQPCNWRAGLKVHDSQIVKLKACLRMKAALARFVVYLAAALGLGEWDVVPNTDASGGRVIVIEGDYFADKRHHDQLMRENEADGNQPVDMLVCVPPQLAIRSSSGESTGSVPGGILEEWGQEVWDAVAEDTRSGYPTSVKQLRLVQYDSCRGLEGWTTINLGLDEFYNYKRSIWRAPVPTDPGVFMDDPALAHLFAARWVMIPMTRAIDTLVIQIGMENSPLREALLKTKHMCSEFMEWKSLGRNPGSG
jgi:hypothetical protein